MMPRALIAFGVSGLLSLGAAGCGGSGGLNAGVPRGVDFTASYRPAVVGRPPRPYKDGTARPRAVRRVAAKKPPPR